MASESGLDCYEELYASGWTPPPCATCGEPLDPMHYYIDTANGGDISLGWDGAEETPFLVNKSRYAGIYASVCMPIDGSFCSRECLLGHVAKWLNALEEERERLHLDRGNPLSDADGSGSC